MNYMKTALLLAALTAFFLAIGYLLGGRGGLMIALVVALGMNFFAYWNSDKMVLRMANARGAEGFVAVTPEARRTFWADRSRTAAIARHTNAFKINEDVVIPLERLGGYSDGIERINIELSIRNKIALLDAVRDFLAGGDLPLYQPGQIGRAHV